ncbi:MAG: MOSC domain-containing protein [Pseudomonadota bacterium]
MKTLDELNEQKPHLLAAPRSAGPVTCVCIRPEEGAREFPRQLELSVRRGAIGDNWERGTWLSLDDGSPSPDVQVSILPQRIYELICTVDGAIHPGDTVIADINLGEDNISVGQRLQVGTAVVQVSNVPNYGCDQWAHRYGRDALRFVAHKENRRYRLRGVLCRIVQDGSVAVGDSVSPVADS